jgi:hypothetical protein
MGKRCVDSRVIIRIATAGVVAVIAAGCSDRDRSRPSAVTASPVEQRSAAMVNAAPPALLDV